MVRSHYLNPCWNIVNGIHKNKFQFNFNRNSSIFIQENALENVVCEMASILSPPQCVKMRPYLIVQNEASKIHNKLEWLWMTKCSCLNSDICIILKWDIIKMISVPNTITSISPYLISEVCGIFDNHAKKWTTVVKLTQSHSTDSGPLFTKDMPSYRSKNPHYKPKTVWWPSQVYNGNPYTKKMVTS